MKNRLLIIFLLLITGFISAQSSVFGKWKSIDDQTGKALAIIEIFEKNNKVYGRVIEVLNPKNKNHICSNCSDEDKDKPIIGLVVMKGLKKDGDEYNGGKILDPKTGKLYKCYINLEDEDKLKVRGYIGISLFGRTQYWHRIK
jgi:uncharacterized protein (DUF2147 family)